MIQLKFRKYERIWEVIVCFLISIFVLSCNKKAELSEDEIKFDKRYEDMSISVSIINLIATPEKYHDKKVLISGFLNIEFESDYIYLNKSDFENSIYKNAIGVDLDQKFRDSIIHDCRNKSYVILEGTFKKIINDYYQPDCGTITKITRIVKR